MLYKQIASYDNFLVANMSLGLLQENNINCHLKDEYIVTIDPLLNPAVGGIKLMVEENDFVTAEGLLKDAETAYINEIPCPFCKSCSLVAEEENNRPTTLWGRMKNIVAYGQAETHKKIYRCNNCKKIMAELPATF